jgi:hypothetical protein
MKGWRSLFMGKSSCFNWHISIHWFIIGLSSISPSPDCYFGAHHVEPHPNILNCFILLIILWSKVWIHPSVSPLYIYISC